MTDAVERLPIVVGVDGSVSATHAVRWAAREAARRQAQLLLVHACAMIPAPTPPGVTLPRSYHEAMLGEGTQWLSEAAATAQQVAPDVTVRTELASGFAAEQLIGRSASAALVVLGSRGLGGFSGLVVGSIAVAVATHGHCPVVVVRGDVVDDDTGTGAGGSEPLSGRPVVVGVDGSAASDAAVSFAFAAAAARGVGVVAVHTWTDVALGSAWEVLEWPEIEAEENTLLIQRLADTQARYPDVPVQRVVARDRPAHTLLEEAKNAQLVVVGSRGRGGFRGLLLGSTSQALIYHAPCPVAVVPLPRQ
jgi:nucleotide-binding universal stress UspA family protein